MAIRVRAWLRRKLASKSETRPRETMPGDPDQQKNPTSQKDTSPPPYATLDLRDGTPQPSIATDENVPLETLRTRNPPRAGSDIVGPPPHSTAPIEAAEAAASTAINGYLRALDEKDRRMVAARTAKAIAVAASTSRSYAAFVAAVTAVESAALLAVEDSRERAPYGQLRERTRNAVHNAANTALAADADTTSAGPWPYSSFGIDTPHLRNQQGQQQYPSWLIWAVGAGASWILEQGSQHLLEQYRLQQQQ
ncbi:hypothetical protein J7T55_000630 [Diaporthe amygdali]|uniref:uncharacterized protein n=1 Tax=Phomopsis amygdali TaxID=1214568 RepID=UPI0022FE4DFE|nr:uncharacterized protein J7T55_000630 [Diaporthe amygdali]KAJ0110198.1 hypothetical protein J7T55_000630 [Diaporthe amygdali]